MSDEKIHRMELDIARLQSKINGYDRVMKATPGKLTISGELDWGEVAMRVVAKRTTSQALANNAVTAVEFTEADQEGAEFWTIADDTKIVIPQDGWWLVIAGMIISANAIGARAVHVMVNDSYDIIRTRTGATSSGKWGMNPSAYVPLKAGDYLELKAFQNSGSPLTMDADDFSPSITVRAL
jgi:hypothetical protein